MINLFRFIGILFIECSAALLSGRNVLGLYNRIHDLFHINTKKMLGLHKMTDIEECYTLMFIVMMADGHPQFSLDMISKEIGLRMKLGDILQRCAENGLLEYVELTNKGWRSSVMLPRAKEHFSEIRNMYIHRGDKDPVLVEGIYKMLQNVYYMTQCNPAWTFISRRGDSEFRNRIMEGLSESERDSLTAGLGRQMPK